jgi:hypothetical protein
MQQLWLQGTFHCQQSSLLQKEQQVLWDLYNYQAHLSIECHLHQHFFFEMFRDIFNTKQSAKNKGNYKDIYRNVKQRFQIYQLGCLNSPFLQLHR